MYQPIIYDIAILGHHAVTQDHLTVIIEYSGTNIDLAKGTFQSPSVTHINVAVIVQDPTSAVEEAVRRYREPLEREVANGSQNREKFERLTIGDLFAIRRLRSARVHNRVLPR